MPLGQQPHSFTSVLQRQNSEKWKCGIRKGSVKASRKEKVEAIEMRVRGGGAKVGEASLVLENSMLMFIMIWIQKTNVVFRIRAKFHRFCDVSFNIPFHFAGLLCNSRGRQARNIVPSSQPAHFVLDGAVLVIKPCFESCWAANQKVVKSGQGSWPGSAAGEAAGAN